jgi:Tfp pilus assembly protein PilN
MIKVNLVGTGRKKAIAPRVKISLPTNFTPVLLVLIVLGSAGGGYKWYADLSAEAAGLDQQIKVLEARKAALDAVIKQDQVYESLKKKLESRVKIIERLTTNQLSPVLALDQLAEAVERTHYVWLSSLEQKDVILSMNGTGTSLSAIADFYSNLNGTGYFKNVDLGTSQESSGNFTFSLKCEFAPPRGVASAPQPAAGGN